MNKSHKALAKGGVASIIFVLQIFSIAGCASSKCRSISHYRTDYALGNLATLDFCKLKKSLQEYANKDSIVIKHLYTKGQRASVDGINNWVNYSQTDSRGMIEIGTIECDDSSAATRRFYREKEFMEAAYGHRNIQCDSIIGSTYCKSQISANKSDAIPLGLCTETGIHENQAMIRVGHEIIIMHERSRASGSEKISLILKQYQVVNKIYENQQEDACGANNKQQ